MNRYMQGGVLVYKAMGEWFRNTHVEGVITLL